MHNRTAGWPARCAHAATLTLIIAVSSRASSQTCVAVHDCGDVDASGDVLTTDALMVLRKAVGEGDTLSCECAPDDSICGNGIIESDEECDVGHLSNQTCLTLGFAAGSLDCGPACKFETTGCYAERFVVSSTGTVYDRRTELMWEMKTSPGEGAADPHDVDNEYTWSGTAGGTSPDGTLFTDFLARLNNNCTVTGPLNGLAASFANACDWRIPTFPELQTILLAAPPCDTSPCIADAFGPVDVSKPYWSSMTIESAPASALLMAFADGSQGQALKSDAAHVLAVRGTWKRKLAAAGQLGCPRVLPPVACPTAGSTAGCTFNYVCVHPSDSGSPYCAPRCDNGSIGTKGTCGTNCLCSDVNPGDATTGACISD